MDRPWLRRRWNNEQREFENVVASVLIFGRLVGTSYRILDYKKLIIVKTRLPNPVAPLFFFLRSTSFSFFHSFVVRLSTACRLSLVSPSLNLTYAKL